MTSDNRLLLTPDEAARRLAISRSHLYMKLASGDIESLLISSSRRITVASIDAYVARLIAEQADVLPANG
jgi:excisionase family DNA binding protein